MNLHLKENGSSKKTTLKEKVRRWLLQLFQDNHAPSRLAIGFALGSCTNFYPTFGLGLPITIALAFLTRTSIIGAVVGENLVKILYPVTIYLSILVGGLIYPDTRLPDNFHAILRICRHWDLFTPYAKLFFTGAIINTVVFGTLLSIIIYYLLTRHRERIITWLSNQEEGKK
ncbi:MAG: DUF2062 domain-containing protein [Acidobacteriota bacterium]